MKHPSSRFRQVVGPSLAILLILLASGCGGGSTGGSGGGSGSSGGSGTGGSTGSTGSGGGAFQARAFPGDYFMRLPNQDGGASIPSEVYDPALKELFISNPDINAVEVYSTVDSHWVGAISVPGPAGLSFVPGGGQLVIGTITPYIYIADPVALHVTSQIAVPASVLTTNQGGSTNMPVVTYAMADGSIFLGMGTNAQSSNEPATSVVHLVHYVPTTGTFTPEDPGTGGVLGNPAVSLDGTSLLVPGTSAIGLELYLYTTAAQGYATTSGTLQTAGFLAANLNGTQFAIVQGTATTETATLLGANLQVESQYALPPTGTAGELFSRDGKYLYVLMVNTSMSGSPVVALDTQTGAVAGYTQFAISDQTPTISDLDENYNLFGSAGSGGAFILNASQLNATDSNVLPQFTTATTNANPSVGPVTGGTQVQFTPVAGPSGPADGIASSMEAYFGGIPGTTDAVGPSPSSSDGQNFLTSTAPAPAAPGPVSVVLTDASDDVVFLPDGYTYGPRILHVTPNTASPQGNSIITIDAYGLGFTVTGTQVTIGGKAAGINNLGSSGAGLYPDQFLTVIVPPGTPGWADIVLTTSNGSYTLSHGFQYLNRQTTVPATGTFTFAVYDTVRDLFYLTGSGNSVAVFNPATQAFQTPLQSPAAVTAGAVLEGEALTPDASELVVADATDQSIIVFNLSANTASTVNVILSTDPVSPPPQPWFVTTAADNRAFVSMSPCIPDPVREINLVNLTVQTRPDAASTCSTYVPYVGMGQSTASGNTIIFGGAIAAMDPPGPEYVWSYSATSDTFTGPVKIADAPWILGQPTVSSDGSVIAVGQGTLDQRLLPLAPLGQGDLSGQLHESGSLLYTSSAAPSILVTDTHNGLQLLSLGMPADISSAPAIDTAGDEILITTTGGVIYSQLSVVPLAVGSVSPGQGAAGTSITITGSGFVAGTTVAIGGQSASCTFTNSQSLTCTVPTLNAGPAPMTLANPDGQTYSLEYAFVVQ
jgi:hypothetical protein